MVVCDVCKKKKELRKTFDHIKLKLNFLSNRTLGKCDTKQRMNLWKSTLLLSMAKEL